MTRLLIATLLLSQAPLLTRQSENGVVTGTIHGPSGAAASGVRVAAMATPAAGTIATSGALVSITETDSSGRYRLENIPPGRYYLIAGLLEFPSFYPGVATMATAKDVQITAGALLTNLDFAMTRPPGVRVLGRVPLTAVPRPLRVLLSGGAVGSLNTTIRPDGTFEFLKVVPGRYSLNLSLSNSIPSLTINVDDVDVFVGLPSGPGFTVRGVVGLGPLSPRLPDQRVVLTGATAWSQVEAIVDRLTGEFLVPDIPPGTYSVRTIPGITSSLATVAVRDREPSRLLLPSLVEVSGSAFLNNGTSLPWSSTALMVDVIRQNGTTLSTVIRQDGTFRLPIIEGEYRIEIGQLPIGTSIESMSYGRVNLLKESLKLDGKSEVAEIRVILSQ